MKQFYIWLLLTTVFSSVYGQSGEKMQGLGTNYFVGGTGASDNNPGTSALPFATIRKAGAVAMAGDIVNIRSGIYRETVIPVNSGTPDNPIIFQPDGDVLVTVSGADIADGGWTAYKGNIYKKTISMTRGYNENMTGNNSLMANQVFVAGKMMNEARWPNLSDPDDLLNRNDFRNGNLAAWSTSGKQTLNDPAIPDISGGWTGGKIWVNGWFISQTRDIIAQKGRQLTLSGSIIDKSPETRFNDYYFLFGKLEALDTPCEWFYDGKQLFLWQPGGGIPADVEVKKRNYAFDLTGKANITIRRITLFAASIITDIKSTNITLDALNAKYINHAMTLTDPDVIYSHTGQIITDAGAAGIRLMGQGSSIRNSVVAFSSNMGIVLGENTTAENNLVHDIAYDGSYASAIVPANLTNGQKILYNTIYRTGRSGIDLMSCRNVEIGFNDMYDFGMLNVDMGAIYSCREHNTSGTRIHHNWIHDHKSIPDGTGIQTGVYFDQASGPAQIDHNVIWMPGGGKSVADIYVQHYSYPVHNIFNNTFASTDVPYSYKNYPENKPYVYDSMKNNIFRDEYQITWLPETPGGTNSLYLSQDPAFINKGTGGLKYRLTPNSPAIDAGATISGVTDGFISSAPDIGAYECGATDWVAGYKSCPEIVTPGTGAAAPSDAIVLFDGTGFSQWRGEKNGEVKWNVENGAMTVVRGTGSIYTRQSFGDCQLHIEWRTPETVIGEGQERGNSGVIFQERYELQVLDSYNNSTYYDGQAGSIYNQSAPLVNASRKPGEWQTYDVVFIAPRYLSNGALETPPYITVFHNGVLIQNNFEIRGVSMPYVTYDAYCNGPLQLQDHGNPVSYRNIWIREL